VHTRDPVGDAEAQLRDGDREAADWYSAFRHDRCPEDRQHSFGWDPSTVKLGAFTWKAPTALANTGVRATVWLAFEDLPLFPTSTSWRRRLQTRAFRAVEWHRIAGGGPERVGGTRRRCGIQGRAV
jgi:hypothetical protein